MSWNGSENKSAASMPQKAARKSPPSKGRGLVALVIIALGGAFAIWFFGGQGKPATSGGEGTRRPTKIAEVKPQIATNKVETAVAKPEKTKAERAEEYWKDKMYVDEKGVKRYPGGMRWLDPNRPVVKIEQPKSRLGKMFKHPSERAIAALLELEPGTKLFGTVQYRKNLTEDLLLSMQEPIAVSEEDSEADRALKQAVEETKKELKARIDAGEDLAKILTDTREEFLRLSAYREDLKAQVDAIIKDESYTDQDVKDFTEAANKMLAKEGLKGLKAPNFYCRQAKLRRARNKKAKENAKETQHE